MVRFKNGGNIVILFFPGRGVYLLWYLILLPESVPRFNVDFGKSEVEVLKHASNYLEPADSEALLDLLANSQLKVIYQQYDWSLNC